MAYVVTGYWNAGYDDQQSSADITSQLQGIAPTEVIELFQLMHLGDERKGLRAVILVPYFIFILYLIFILLWEGTEVNAIWTS